MPRLVAKYSPDIEGRKSGCDRNIETYGSSRIKAEAEGYTEDSLIAKNLVNVPEVRFAFIHYFFHRRAG
jgi:hypothetical protein